MCGISGLCIRNSSLLHLPQTLREMSLRLRHRGPDDEGFVFIGNDRSCVAGSDDTVEAAWQAPFAYAPHCRITEVDPSYTLGMAHRRLSVIDLTEAGHQPMCNADASIWIVCNGEIYNHHELRAELETLGHQFRTRSDIEVLLRAYEQWGVRCLDKLNGMWSFVICDRRQQLLFGSRDRFGVKPLYYYHDDALFAFASEHKALMAVPGVRTGISREAVYEHLLLGNVEMREEGFFQNIFELKPGHSFTYDLDTHRLGIRKYYNLSYLDRDEHVDETRYKQAVEEVREKVVRAVDLRLSSEVPVGFCLSGGLDSSSIVCISENIRKERQLQQLSSHLHTFTAVNNGGAYDEASWAAKIAEAVGAGSYQAHCRAEDILPALDDLIWHQDVPLFSTSTFAQSQVMKCAKEQGMTILLDGQGGDELFAGYQTFYTSLLWNYFNHGRFGDMFREIRSFKYSPTSTSIVAKSLIKLLFQNALSPGARDRMAARYRPELKYFDSSTRKQYSGLLNLAGEFSEVPVNELLHHYFTGYYLKNLLRWEDRCSMQYSIESRTPFSDDIDLIETVFSIPSSFKIRKGRSKSLLREAMSGIVPDEVRLRIDKLGFATPQSDWLMQIAAPLKQRIQDLAGSDDLGIIDARLLLNDWDRVFKNPSLWKARDFAFRYLCYLIWRGQFFGTEKIA
jgi:asparagine synthase (glutamine-hydrolysing)